MDKETAKKILQKTTEDYKKISKEFIQTRIKPWAVFDKFKKYVKDNDKVLDVGCGGGRLIEIFKGADVEYVGFDTSEEAIDSARNTYGSFFKISPKFIIHDIVDFPWPWTGESFDVVFVVAVLHHIPSKEFRQDVLKEIKRVLKPGGKLIMTNWNLRSIWAIKKFWPEILRLIFPRKDLDRGDFFAPWKLKSGEQVHRFHHSFSIKEVKEELEAAGFDILENYYTINGEKANWFSGRNILTIVKKKRGTTNMTEQKQKQLLVFLGPQGSGKGTQAKLLAKDSGKPHISTGDIFREEREKDTERGKLIRSLIDAGNLVPDKITNEMVRDRLNQPDCENGAILDGYPRNLAQAKVLNRMWRDGTIKAVLIDIPDEVAKERAIYRRSCKKCGKIYHLKYNPPKSDEVCDTCGGKLVWRDDDKEEQIELRLKTYHEKTEPLVEYYRNKGILIEIDGVGTIDEVYKRIRNAI